jgi:3',5'-nucleoside bisphosphate phosphatase
LRIDLHIHSTASDGSLPPAAVVAAARAGGLHIIALADHDTLAGIAPAQAAAHGVLHVIPALELSTHHNGAELHMLGYFVDVKNAALVQYSGRAGNARALRMREMLARLDEVGVSIAFDEVVAAAGPRPESLGRPHLARAMLQRGYVTTVSDAFDRYIGDDCPAFVPTRLISPAEGIGLIHAAGGVAVWAHPRPDQLHVDLARFVEWGLDGVECYRPRVSHVDAERVANLARMYQLLITGGSDWHGEWQGRLGDFSLERDDVAEFLDAGGI